MTDKIKIGEHEIHTVGSEEAEQCDAVVCQRVADTEPLDDLPPAWREFVERTRARSSEEPCSVCGETVIVDSLSPKTPPRICLPCVLEMLEAIKQ